MNPSKNFSILFPRKNLPLWLPWVKTTMKNLMKINNCGSMLLNWEDVLKREEIRNYNVTCVNRKHPFKGSYTRVKGHFNFYYWVVILLEIGNDILTQPLGTIAMWLLEDPSPYGWWGDGNKCLKRYFDNQAERSKVTIEFGKFSGCSGQFAEYDSIHNRYRMDPYSWWCAYGAFAPTLQKVGLRVLGTTGLLMLLWEELDYLLLCSHSQKEQNDLAKSRGLGVCS